MTLDPIVSLSVAVAEAAGSYAFLLGSGVSRDAGVPTGSQVFWQAVGELYRLEKKVTETPDRDALTIWLTETEREQLTYSGLLELIAPDAATRRDYLAKHFEGHEPGKSHEQLAVLAEQGYARVFITTNFDRLLEHALQARGIEPVVITSAAELRSAPKREHAQCYVLKPHGDYLQETIRNTQSELERLESGIAKELREIFERFGIIVLGYSGSDEAVASLLSARRSRYGLYWVARGELTAPAHKIVEATGGRIIERANAADFLSDLQRRLEVFRSHPSGHTPLEVHDEVMTLVRAGDTIGLAEVMRRERRELADGLEKVIGEHREQRPEDGNLLKVHDAMLPMWERRLAAMLPVIAYAPEVFEREVRSLTDLLENQPIEGGFAAWRDMIDWATWWLGYASGAFALTQESWPALNALLSARYTTWSERERYLVEPVRESIGHNLGAVVMRRFSESRWIRPRWQHLIWSLHEASVFQDRWPEFLRGKSPPREALSDFDFLVTLRRGMEGEQPLTHWTLGDNEAVRPARRMKSDPKFRSAVAELLGVESEKLIDTAKAALANLQRAPQAFGGEEAIRTVLADES